MIDRRHQSLAYRLARRQYLLEQLKSDWVYERVMAVTDGYAGEIVLGEALKDPHYRMRYHAARHLNSTPEIVLAALRDLHPLVRDLTASDYKVTEDQIRQQLLTGGDR